MAPLLHFTRCAPCLIYDLCIRHIEEGEGDPGFPTAGCSLIYAFLSFCAVDQGHEPANLFGYFAQYGLVTLPATEHGAWVEQEPV